MNLKQAGPNLSLMYHFDTLLGLLVDILSQYSVLLLQAYYIPNFLELHQVTFHDLEI